METKLKHPIQVVEIAKPQEIEGKPVPVASSNVQAGFPSPQKITSRNS